ncbi:MAG TPA: hypothetical protein VFE98_00705 [Candidatus Bathyarchaeia archaeon]|nr:hypothetical protein [Candidatus Bathyarchaeia archaeon]
MSPGAQLSGLYPRSEILVELTRSYERGRISWGDAQKQLDVDTAEIVRLQDEYGFDVFSDGSFSWQDQLRPIVGSFEGVTSGTGYSRWFDTNTFYRKPIVEGKVSLGKVELQNFLSSDLQPKGKRWKVTLPGPYTLSELSDNEHYKSKAELVSDIANAEAALIKRLRLEGIDSFQLGEPCLVYQPYREKFAGERELKLALSAIERITQDDPASIILQTYFGDASKILPSLLKLNVGTVGFDVFETDYSSLKLETDKNIALGIVDSRDSNVEDPAWIAETALRAIKHVSGGDVVFVPNADLKLVPRHVADAKARSLGEARKLFGEQT